MGNAESYADVDSNYGSSGHFVINFMSSGDVPSSEFLSESGVYLRAYLSRLLDQDTDQHERLSVMVTSLVKSNSSTALWNCYRDFFMDPGVNVDLTVEIMTGSKNNEGEMVGVVHIPTAKLTDSAPKSFKFNHSKVFILLLAFKITFSYLFIFNFSAYLPSKMP